MKRTNYLTRQIALLKSFFLFVLFTALMGNWGWGQYCSTLYTTGCSDGDNIDNINISDLTHTSTGCTGGTGYADFSGTIVHLVQNTTYPFSIDCGYVSGEWVGAWIDFNDDGDYDDTDEFVGGTTSASTSNTITGSLSIPVTATIGNHRMRIRLVFGTQQTSTTSCTSYKWGETHDYTCTIASPCTSTITLASNNVAAANICAGTTKVPLQSFSLAVAAGCNGNLTNVGFTTTGTYVQADISKYQLWYNSSNSLAGATQLGTDLASVGGAGARTFAAFTSPTLTAGSTYYFWITADVAATATNNNTIAVNAMLTSNLTSTSTKVLGSNAAGGTQTLKALATATAGTAISTCASSGAVNITAGSSATNYSAVAWSSSGTGTFTNTNSLTTCTYTPSAADITAGSVTLTLTATGNAPCSNATSAKTLTIYPDIPTITVQPASQIAMLGGTATFSVTATGIGLTYQWQRGISGTYTNITAGTTPNDGCTYSGYNTNTLTATGAVVGMNGYTYRCNVLSTCSATPAVTNGSAALTVTTCVSGFVNVLGTSPASSANYGTLKEAFDAINAGTHKGSITVNIGKSTTETATAALNASGTGSSSYTSVLVQPCGGARTITSSFNPAINLNGADNVTIDGLNTGGNSLTIDGTSTANTASTIRFISDATNNIVRNCTLKGAGTGTATGTVFFSTATTTGNDNNTITNCNIGDGTTKPYIGICSIGTSGKENSNNTISNCNVYNFRNPCGSASGFDAGIYLGSANNLWSITGNSVYQTASYTDNTYETNHYGIRIDGASGSFTITDNYIGGSAASCGGSHWIMGSSGTHIKSRFRGIYLKVGGTDTTRVLRNTVAGIDLYSTLVYTNVGKINIDDSATLMGIYTRNGLTNVSNNIIGSQSATDNIIFSANGSYQAHCMGILCASTNSWTSNNNIIGGITAKNTGSAYTQIYCLELIPKANGLKWICNNNTIGGTVAKSVQTVSGNGSAPNMVHGIFSGDPNTYKPIYEITNNTVRNLDASASAGVIGILTVSQYYSAGNIIKGNTVYNLSSTVSGKEVYGINVKWGGGVTISNNSIRSISSDGITYAIYSNNNKTNGAILVKNNWIKLGFNESGGAIGTGTFYGIYEKAETVGEANAYYHNSVYIGGSRPAYAFYNTGTIGTTSNCKNNIFYNCSSNGTAYSIYITGTQDVVANNIYFKSGTNFSAYRNGTTYTNNFATWQTNASDPNSKVADPLYVNATANGSSFDLHINPATSPALEAGTDLNVTDDWDAEFRNDYPEIGADEVCKLNTTAAALTSPYDVGAGDYVFSGVTATDWNTAGSWYKTQWDATFSIYRTYASATVPTSADNVYIAGTTCWNNYNAVISVADASCKDLYILGTDAYGTFSLTMSNSRTLNIYGDYMNYGSFVCGNGTVNFTGATANVARSNWTSTPANMFYNVSVDKGTGSLTLKGSDATNATADINNNFTLTSGTWDVGTTTTNYPMYVFGNWTYNSGTFVPRSGKVTLDGSGAQTIGGTLNTSFYDLEVKNTSANTIGVTVATTPTITHVLTLTDGKVTTGTNRVDVTNTAATSVAAGTGNTNYENSWIFGNLRRYVTGGGPLTYDVPVGNTNFAFLAKLVSNGFTYTYLDCKFNDPLTTTGGALNPALARDFGTPYTSIHTAGEWQIDGTGTAGGTYDMYGYTSHFTGLTDNTFAILKRPSSSTSDADWIGETAGTINANGGTGRITASGFALRMGMNGFSKFGIGIALGPLPVELLALNAHCNSEGVKVNWATATEENNDYFTLERSTNMKNWEVLTTVAGAGNSNQIENYSFTDDNAPEGTNYYRLRQTDYDGRSETFDPVSVSCESGPQPSLLLYPNPATDQLVLQFSNIATEDVRIAVTDVLGRTVLEYVPNAGSQLESRITLDLSNLSPGSYFVKFRAGDFGEVRQIVKN